MLLYSSRRCTSPIPWQVAPETEPTICVPKYVGSPNASSSIVTLRRIGSASLDPQFNDRSDRTLIDCKMLLNPFSFKTLEWFNVVRKSSKQTGKFNQSKWFITPIQCKFLFSLNSLPLFSEFEVIIHFPAPTFRKDTFHFVGAKVIFKPPVVHARQHGRLNHGSLTL